MEPITRRNTEGKDIFNGLPAVLLFGTQGVKRRRLKELLKAARFLYIITR